LEFHIASNLSFRIVEFQLVTDELLPPRFLCNRAGHIEPSPVRPASKFLGAAQNTLDMTVTVKQQSFGQAMPAARNAKRRQNRSHNGPVIAYLQFVVNWPKTLQRS
jgi:hypothetical protein